MRYADVIFDFCGVLVDWQPAAALEGRYPSEVIDAFLDPDDEWGFWHYDHCSDMGMGEPDILEEYAGHHDPSLAQVFRVYFERYRLALRGMMPGMAALLRELDAAGVRCWGLTNFTTPYVVAARERFPALGVLRDVVISSEERIGKPDPVIYRRAVARFGVDPAAAAFVDDRRVNAEAASLAVPGLTGILFADAASLRARLV
ncbi:HAD-IA family hydrolase [Bifidobacterium sp. UBA744]|uniref:HAD-IA family hydrolase n=1 Tax=Bifidobacterium sp. UBA744 TaxID=1946112 RepID=UPI0025C31407|nr:HAD-IA family hydrolase [Bifidobacterium sp. UBA744]